MRSGPGAACTHLSRRVGWNDCQLGLSKLLLSGAGGEGAGGGGAGGGTLGGPFLPTVGAVAALLLAMSVAVAAVALVGAYSSAAIFAGRAASVRGGGAPCALAQCRGLWGGSARTRSAVRHCATRPCRQARGSSMGPRQPLLPHQPPAARPQGAPSRLRVLRVPGTGPPSGPPLRHEAVLCEPVGPPLALTPPQHCLTSTPWPRPMRGAYPRPRPRLRAPPADEEGVQDAGRSRPRCGGDTQGPVAVCLQLLSIPPPPPQCPEGPLWAEGRAQGAAICTFIAIGDC